MLVEEVNILIDNIDVTNKTISIAKDIIIKKDGVEIARNRERCAFAPGDIENVKIYLNVANSPEIDYLNAIWTDEVIAAYKANISE